MCCIVVNAQHTILFKGQVYHNKSGAQKNMTVLINNQYPAVTNDAGIFQIALPDETNHIRVSLAKPRYAILYPPGGYVLVPRDLNEAPQVILGDIRDNKPLNTYLTIYKQIKSNSATSADMEALNKKLDSLEQMLLQMNYTRAELTSAREMQEKRDDYLPEINTTLTDYYNTATDLETAFKYVSDYAFHNAAALEQLGSAIRNYNAGFQKLYNQHLNFEKRVGDYWQSDSLKVEFTRLTGFALDTIHRQKIFPMQETIGEIRKYFTAGLKDAALKKSIQQNIARHVSELEVLLPKLDEQMKSLLRELNIL